MSQKVYILDYESITPLGLGDDEILKSLKLNHLPGKDLSHFSTAGLKTHGAACVEADLTPFFENCSDQVKELAHFDRKFELLVATYKKCESRLRDVISKCDSKRAGVVLGVGLDVSPLEKIDKYMQVYKENSLDAFNNVLMDFNEKNENRVPIFQNPLDLSSLYLAEELGLGAFQKTVISACTSSTQAIALAYRSIHRGDTDIVLTGGTDSILNLMAYTAFGKLGVIAKSDKAVHEYCKPFDKNRTGALVGEAAGLCLMVGEEFVKKHGLKPKFEMIGYGNSLDGYKITSADPTGKGMKSVVKMAIEMGGIKASDIDYVNLHGTGTRLNDELEIESFLSVVGEQGQGISVSSTKSRHGHAIAAAGIQEFNLLCKCMEENFVPATMNLENPVVGNEIDLLKENKNKELKVGMTNNFAFGGVNTSLIIRKL